jgi:rhamnose transport system substrate-binding protein
MIKRSIGLLIAAALVLTSCQKSESTSMTGGAKPTTAKDVKIVYIPKNTGNPYFDSIIDGFKESAANTGAQFDTIGPSTPDATSQIPIIKDQLQRGVNVICISPNSPDALNQVFKEAVSKGVTMICVDADLTGNESLRTACVLPTDPKEVAKVQLDMLGEQIGFKGKFAILSATTDAPNQNLWIKYMKEFLQNDPKYKDMELIATVYGDDVDAKSNTEAEALLTKYPDLRGIIAPTTVGISAAAHVVQSAHKADQVIVTGLGRPNDMRNFVKDGTVKQFALWITKDQGYVAGELAVQLAMGKLRPERGATFQAGSKGERSFRENNIVIASPPVVFNKDNIDQYQF